MVLYRISNCQHAKDLNGTGAKLVGGRWNSIGTPLHYMASSRALAALEVLANTNTLTDAKNLCLTLFELPENSIKIIDKHELPEDWRTYPAPPVLQNIGDRFVKQSEFLLLQVPSAIIADEFNYLMNVSHPLADQISIIETKSFSFDSRLF
ncbi:RES family NAD+ phosphorylase [Pedobacter sp. MC2016-14]|uniref:RES family NAD+ phosphorylase n=1 Tax=Pedobacter sp. MC2016-14 TaxID=2897327 RepID=UPI001E4086E8|nr:RES family NAD+ phosphorylase [Pedobacter sp. MC2016-14]MCD0488443.1 RES family NAD+ phosphorylase [Pedobacter sp. MC2016-14]